jgi:anti-sigma regulatory factor (Ser/Thr protein kinase)
VRRACAAVCRSLGFAESEIGKVSLIATELATNLVKHATTGQQVLLRSLAWGDRLGIEILALDRGPGIADLTRSLRDGHSTVGSPGIGLGGIQRSSSEFEIYSKAGQGTAVMSRVWAQGPARPSPPRIAEVGAVCLPLRADEPCGDAWTVEQSEHRAIALVADGLGHGADAAQAAQATVALFSKVAAKDPLSIVETIHAGLRGTRGAAVAVAELDAARRVVRFTGIGNISACIYRGQGCRSLVSHNGIAGGEARKIQEFSYPWPRDGLLLLHSDGLATHWSFDNYPGLSARHPTLIAGVLYRDLSRQRDDTTVLALKETRTSS